MLFRGGIPLPDSCYLLLAKGLAVGTLIGSGVCLMGAYQDPLQRAEVIGIAVISALGYGTLDALVGLAVHCSFLLFR